MRTLKLALALPDRSPSQDRRWRPAQPPAGIPGGAEDLQARRLKRADCEPGHTRATLCRIRLAPRSVCWTRAQAFTALCLYIETVAPYRAGRYLPPFNHTGTTPGRFANTQTLQLSPPRPLRV